MNTSYYMKRFLSSSFILLFLCFLHASCHTAQTSESKVCDERDFIVVVLYTNNWCGWCKEAEKFLLDNNVDFVKRDVEDPNNYKNLQETAIRLEYSGNLNVVPIFVVGGQIITGYDPINVMAALEKERLAKWMILSRR